MEHRKCINNPDAKPAPPGTAGQSVNQWMKKLLRVFKQAALRTMNLKSKRLKQFGNPRGGKNSEGNQLRKAYLRRLGIKIDTKIVGSKVRASNDKSTSTVESHKSCENSGSIPTERDQENFRLHYLQKLSYRKIWLPQHLRLPQKQTVIIFDWDDTLLCTSFLNHQGEINKVSVQQNLPELRKIGVAARRLLELAQ